ncbi:hypothetical protein [Paludibacter sp.]|uniref:hypothetical protein n=1 Tax=Paludibacter sp. TaxID=1898105 RepID=UPI001355ACEE|nr:hypothetical protein [Paludibacter sp.]MTK52174.1 hypothetical protein [Paludibacter sp.]
MKVNYSKKGSKWQVVFTVENVDSSGMTIAGNFNDWDSKDAKSAFLNGGKEVKVSLPADSTFLSFKVYDNTNDCWCEVYDNGELYAGLEPYFVRNEMGTINIVVPLFEEVKPKATRKAPVKKVAEPKETKAPAKKTAKKSAAK